VLAKESRAVHHLGPTGQDRPQQDRVVGRVVLEVGVLDQQDIAGRMAQALADGGALALVARQQVQVEVAPRGLLAQDIAGAVGREVVDDDDLLLDVAEVDRPYLIEQRRDGIFLVVAGDDDRELQRSAPLAREA